MMENCYIGSVKSRYFVYSLSLLLTFLCIQSFGHVAIQKESLQRAGLEVLAQDPEPVSEIELVTSANVTVSSYNTGEKFGPGLLHFSISSARYFHEKKPHKQQGKSLPLRYLQHIYPSHFFW
jgi:hypothetical protein